MSRKTIHTNLVGQSLRTFLGFNLHKLLPPPLLSCSGSLGAGMGYFGGQMLVKKSTSFGRRGAWVHFLSLPLGPHGLGCVT